MDHQTFRKRVKPKQQINFEDSCLGGGLKCDLSVKFNACRLPLNDRIPHSKNRTKNTGQITPKIYTDCKKYLENFMKGLSKQELCDYIVQLLNCPPDSTFESIRCCHQDGSTLNSLPEDSLPSLPRSNDLRCRHSRQSSRADNRRSKPSNNKHAFGKEEVIKSLKNIYQDCSRGNHEQSYFNNIISAIDLLCDMRSLFDQTLTVESNNMDESPRSENKLAQSIDKNSKHRCTDGEWRKESVVTKCNKRVQTEESLIHLTPDQKINFYHGHDQECLDDQANSYDRFKNNFCHLQAPYPLIPPRANLKTYKTYRSDAY